MAGCAVHPDLATVSLDDSSSNRKADSGAALRPISRVVRAVEPLEDQCLLGGRQAGTLVSDLHARDALLDSELEPDCGATGSVRQRVADEIVQHLGHASSVASGRRMIGCGEFEPHASRRCRKSVALSGLLEEALQVDRLTLQVLRGEFGAGAEVVNQAFKPMELSQ